MLSKSVPSMVAVFLIAIASFACAQSIVTEEHCTTPNGERASCISLEQCTFLYNMLLKKPMSDEEKLFLGRSQCGFRNGKVLVCCPNRYVNVRQPEIVMRASLPEISTCGNIISNRIYGGNATKIDEFPWMALIEYDKDGSSMGHYCGGSLINNRYVLTAAHCIRSGVIPETWKPIRVRLGEWDTSTDPDCETYSGGSKVCSDPHVDVPIESAISHPNYVSTSNNQIYDIALLRLSRSVAYTNFIRPICLPIKNSLKNVSYDRVLMDVAGWGKTEQGAASNLKLKAEVPGVPLIDCQRVYSQRGLQLENSQLCAGGRSGTDSCNGDSGGALIALDESNKSQVYNYIAGVISFGPNPCALQGWPGIYTKVSNYVDWIQQNIRP